MEAQDEQFGGICINELMKQIQKCLYLQFLLNLHGSYLDNSVQNVHWGLGLFGLAVIY